MYADAQRLVTVGINAAGTGYAAGDVLTLPGGLPLHNDPGQDPDCYARVLVAAVDGSGAITKIAPLAFGAYLVAPVSPATVTGGQGSGAAIQFETALYWTNADWVTVAGTDLAQVLAPEILADANADLSNPASPGASGQAIDPSVITAGKDRGSLLVAQFVSKVRQAVRNGDKVPMNNPYPAGEAPPDPDTLVPPEAVLHVLNMAAFELVSSTPNLKWVVMTEKGPYAPLAKLAQEGRDWLNRVRGGEPVTYPSDPDPNWQPSIRIGSNTEQADLRTFGAPIIAYPGASTLGTL